SAFQEQVRRSLESVDAISLPAVFAPGTRDLTLLAASAPQGAGAAVYVFDSCVVDGPGADWVSVFSTGLFSAACGAARGPDDSAQPAAARTTTGDRRAVRASGRGKERTAHFSWGTVRSRSALRTGRPVSHESRWGGRANSLRRDAVTATHRTAPVFVLLNPVNSDYVRCRRAAELGRPAGHGTRAVHASEANFSRASSA